MVAALLFRNVYGTSAERALDVFVALSALGNVLAVVSANGVLTNQFRLTILNHFLRQIFSQGRVNQELGREGILPFSKVWGSNRPFNAPLAGLGLRKSLPFE